MWSNGKYLAWKNEKAIDLLHGYHDLKWFQKPLVVIETIKRGNKEKLITCTVFKSYIKNGFDV